MYLYSVKEKNRSIVKNTYIMHIPKSFSNTSHYINKDSKYFWEIRFLRGDFFRPLTDLSNLSDAFGRRWGSWLWGCFSFRDFLVVGGGKKWGRVFRKAALGSCLLWDNWVIFLLLFLWFFLRPVSLWQPFWMVLFWLAFLPLLVHLLGNRLWCPSQCCCGAFPPRGWVGWFR